MVWYDVYAKSRRDGAQKCASPFLWTGGDAQGSMAGRQITPEKILEELAAIAFAKVPDYMVLEGSQLHLREDLKPRQRAAIASVENSTSGVKVKFYDKMKALELLGKHFGLFEAKGMQEDRENNLLEAILQATEQEVDTLDVSELQQAAAAGNDLVESPGP